MSVPDDLLYRVSQSRKQHKQEAKDKYNEQSKSQLLGIIDKKLHTTFIGALAQFEKQFGFLWQQKNRKITEEEREIIEMLDRAGFCKEFWEDLWLDARDKVLENGNNQLKALKKEVKNYTISWNRFHIDLPIKNNSNNNNDREED